MPKAFHLNILYTMKPNLNQRHLLVVHSYKKDSTYSVFDSNICYQCISALLLTGASSHALQLIVSLNTFRSIRIFDCLIIIFVSSQWSSDSIAMLVQNQEFPHLQLIALFCEIEKIQPQDFIVISVYIFFVFFFHLFTYLRFNTFIRQWCVVYFSVFVCLLMSFLLYSHYSVHFHFI